MLCINQSFNCHFTLKIDNKAKLLLPKKFSTDILVQWYIRINLNVCNGIYNTNRGNNNMCSHSCIDQSVILFLSR